MDEGFGTFDHTGDLGLEVRAATPERLFELAAVGLMAQLAEPRPGSGAGASLQAAVGIAAGDPAALLVDWLNAALLEAELRHAFWTGAALERLDLAPAALRARLTGAPRDRARFTFLREVKAVSHHAAELSLAPGACRCRVVLDI